MLQMPTGRALQPFQKQTQLLYSKCNAARKCFKVPIYGHCRHVKLSYIANVMCPQSASNAVFMGITAVLRVNSAITLPFVHYAHALKARYIFHARHYQFIKISAYNRFSIKYVKTYLYCETALKWPRYITLRGIYDVLLNDKVTFN